MSEMLKTDAELLQCSPRVDPAQFPKALSNRIARGYGKIHSYIHSINTIYIFVPKRISSDQSISV